MATTDTNIYRSVAKKLNDSSSSEEGELSTDDDSCDDQSTMKRQRMTSSGNMIGMSTDVITPPQLTTNVNIPPPREALPPKRKNKFQNIWSNVITEQSSNDIASSLGNVGMKNFMSRYVMVSYHFYASANLKGYCDHHMSIIRMYLCMYYDVCVVFHTFL